MQIQHPIPASDSGSHDRANDDRAIPDRVIDPAPALDRIALALVEAHFADFRRRITRALGVEHLEAESLALAWTTGFSSREDEIPGKSTGFASREDEIPGKSTGSASREDEIAPPPAKDGEAKNQRLVGPKSPPSGAGATPTS